jgi:heptaprenylglyceryl phosphate synthase
LIVGGGINNNEQVKSLYDNGANLVVIGTAIEKNPRTLEQFSSLN